MRRRSFLLTATASLAASAGCLGSDERLARLAWINLQNHREESYDVEIVVEDGGEPVFSSTYHLGEDSEIANILEENPVEGDGKYIVSAALDGGKREVDTTDFIDEDETCVGVRFELLDNGDVDYWTKSMQEC